MKRQNSRKLFSARTNRIAVLIAREVQYALSEAALQNDSLRDALKGYDGRIQVRSFIRERFETPLVMREIRRLLRGT